jgi:hypothetical protein
LANWLAKLLTRILTIIALLFATPAWAGEVDGNSFFCSPEVYRYSSRFLAVSFEDGIALHFDEQGIETQINYWVEPDVVGYEWHSNGGYRINRKTLKMQFKLGGDAVSEWSCQFMEKNKSRKKVVEMTMARDREQREGNQF